MGLSPPSSWRRFILERQAAVAPLAALVITMLVGFAAFAVDTGSFFYSKRRQQAASDLAAIAAASDLGNARRAASATVVANGFQPEDLVGLETGIYSADPLVAPDNRFVVGISNPNAARVTMRAQSPIFFGRIFSNATGVSIGSRAIAANSDLAAFSIGSRLAALDGGIANAVLSGLLGANVNLSLADYQSLATANIDLFSFSSALSTRLGLTGPTYDSLGAGNVRVADVLSAMLDTARSGAQSSSAISALGQVVRAKSASSDALAFGSLANFGPLGKMQVGTRPFAASASLLDLLNATLSIANGTHQVELALPVSLPGLLAASVRLAIGERPVGRSAYAFGSNKVTAYTAQVRLLVTATLGGAGPIASVNLPLYVDIAQSQATLAAIQCDRVDIRSTTVKLAVTPGLVDGWIGQVGTAQFANFTAPPSPGPATLVSVGGLVTVKGLAHAQIANTSPTSVTFSYADIQQGTRKTTSTTDFVAPLVASLIGNLNLDVNVLGLGLPLTFRSATLQAITAAAPSLDLLVAQLLASLGVGLGQADTWVDGVRCGGAVLVD